MDIYDIESYLLTQGYTEKDFNKILDDSIDHDDYIKKLINRIGSIEFYSLF